MQFDLPDGRSVLPCENVGITLGLHEGFDIIGIDEGTAVGIEDGTSVGTDDGRLTRSKPDGRALPPDDGLALAHTGLELGSPEGSSEDSLLLLLLSLLLAASVGISVG